MNTRRLSKRTLPIATITLSASLALSGCSLPSVSDVGSMMDHMDHVTGMAQDLIGTLTNTDVMFAQMMIAHHQQAVDMGTLAETHASDPAVKEIAARIKSEQAPEIEQMKKWLKDAGKSESMDHEMPMQGMLTKEQLDTLAAATGPEFDKMYLNFMILHHQGAVLMAQMVENSTNSQVSDFAKAIIETQNAEIKEMQELLRK